MQAICNEMIGVSFKEIHRALAPLLISPIDVISKDEIDAGKHDIFPAKTFNTIKYSTLSRKDVENLLNASATPLEIYSPQNTNYYETYTPDEILELLRKSDLI